MPNSFKTANILLPKNIDMKKWSVVACDQYTSEPDYWKQVEQIVGDAPSSLHITFPEIYLSEGNVRIESINRKMIEYISQNIFTEYKNSFIYLKRSLSNGKVRNGLIGAIDLEDYCFRKGSTSNIRATEGTVLERIPPRVKIRENAELEFPHIMILIDDPKKTVIEPLNNSIDDFEKVYDFELMQNGGHVAGYCVDSSSKNAISKALDNLSEPQNFCNKYKVENTPVLTFAVGDGNHSLATAKTCWENIKKTLTSAEIEVHPARYALIELVNLHDESLVFEPIHRVMFDVDPNDVINEIKNFYPNTENIDNGGKMITYSTKNEVNKLWIKDDNNNLAVGTLQCFIDNYLSTHTGSVDYIHGEKVVLNLSNNANNIGFLLPAMKKSELFKTVILDGALPRKTFSMGEACEKRYYLEGKKIK